MEPLPKAVYVGKTTLSMGVASAVISFNDGNGGILDAMKNYGLEVGDCCTDFCVQRDASSIKEMERKSCDSAKKCRNRRRLSEKAFAPDLCEILED